MARSNTGSSSNYITCASSVNDGTPPLSFHCWAKFSALTARMDLVMQGNNADTSGPRQHLLTCMGSVAGDPIRFRSDNNSGGSGVADSTFSTSTGTWLQCGGVVSATNSRAVYVNGGNKATNTTNVTSNTSHDKICIGIRATSGLAVNFGIDGSIGEVAIWTADIGDAGMSQLAKGYSPLLVRPDALGLYMPITGRISPEPELIGARSGTVTGTMSQAAHPLIIRPTSHGRRQGFLGDASVTRDYDSIMPVDWMVMRQIDAALPLSYAGIVSVDAPLPVEWTLGLYTDEALYVEWRLNVASDSAMPVAYEPLQAFDVALPVEHLLKLDARYTLPVEWLAPAFYIVQPQIARGFASRSGREALVFDRSHPSNWQRQYGSLQTMQAYSGNMIVGGPPGIFRLPGVRYAKLTLKLGDLVINQFVATIGDIIWPSWTPENPVSSEWKNAER